MEGCRERLGGGHCWGKGVSALVHDLKGALFGSSESGVEGGGTWLLLTRMSFTGLTFWNVDFLHTRLTIVKV